jgi:hypothetical protein
MRFNPLRYVTVTVVPGAKLAPAVVTGVRLHPDTGDNAIWAAAGAGGSTPMGVTVRTAVPESRAAESVAVIVAAPVATPVARPWEPVAFEIVAVPESDEAHVTASVRSWVLESE